MMMNEKMNIAKQTYSGSFLRFVPISEQWKDELYSCYTNHYLQKYIDDHNCETIFQFQNQDEMARCIEEWKQAWEENRYFRWVVETKNDHQIIGTIEIASLPNTTDYIHCVFNKKPGTFVHNPTHLFEQGVQDGVLRIDVISEYALEQIFDDILNVTQKFFADYGLQQIIVQCLANDEERKKALEKHGFENLKNEGEILYPYRIKSLSASD
jgi:RimJ/RimL family protein N-acetyltransferase